MAYVPKPESVPKYYAVVSQLQAGVPLKRALNYEHLGYETFTRLQRYLATSETTGYNADKELVKRVGKEYQIDALPFHLLLSNGQTMRDVPLDFRNASLVGTYWNEVDNALLGRVAGLQQFQSVVISDIHGNRYHLLTDVNALRAWLDSMTGREQREFFATLYQLKGASRNAA